MATAQNPRTPPFVNDDPSRAAAVERGKASVRRLQEMGIIDAGHPAAGSRPFIPSPVSVSHASTPMIAPLS